MTAPVRRFSPDRLQMYRQSRNLSKRKLAALVGCSENMIYKYEQGVHTPRHDNLLKLSAHLGCQWHDLMPVCSGSGGAGTVGPDHTEDRLVNELVNLSDSAFDRVVFASRQVRQRASSGGGNTS